MKNIILFILGCFLSLRSIPAQEIDMEVPTDEPKFAVGIENTFCSKYLWNGISYNEGLIAQPEIWLSVGNFTFDFWSSYTIREKNNEIKQHEVDLGIYYQLALGDLTISPGFLYYIYPDQDDSPSTGELVLNAAYQINDNFQLESELITDVIEYKGIFYGYHGLNFNLQLNDNYEFESSFGLGWANNKFNTIYIGYEKQAINYFVIGAGLNANFLSPIILKPFFEFYSIPNSELSSFINKNNFNYGLKLSTEL